MIKSNPDSPTRDPTPLMNANCQIGATTDFAPPQRRPARWSIPARNPPLRAVNPGAAALPFSEAKLPAPQNQPPYRGIASSRAAAKASIAGGELDNAACDLAGKTSDPAAGASDTADRAEPQRSRTIRLAHCAFKIAVVVTAENTVSFVGSTTTAWFGKLPGAPVAGLRVNSTDWASGASQRDGRCRKRSGSDGPAVETAAFGFLLSRYIATFPF